MNAVIIEDENRAANRLQRLLLKVAPDIRVLAQVESIREAVELFQEIPPPDLIFSDIQLADGLSFRIFEQVSLNCPIIFTTAYDQYAIEAFQTNGIDYLLKPVEEERLQQALVKLQRFTPSVSSDQVRALMAAMQPGPRYKQRFLAKVGDEIKSFTAQQIRAFFSEQKATFVLLDNGRRYILDQTLGELEGQLDPGRFFRVSRKHIVAVDACDKIYAFRNSRLKLVVAGLEDQEVIVSRERVADFKAWLGGD